MRYRLEAVSDERITRVVDAVKQTHVNGGMLVACFAPLTAVSFDASSNSDLREKFHAVRTFLGSPDLTDRIPELNPISGIAKLTFCRLGCYALEGEIAQILRSSGAYKDSDLSPDDARRMAIGFIDALGQDNRENVIAYRTEERWTEWLYDVAWDVTLIVTDGLHTRWWLICVTDTD